MSNTEQGNLPTTTDNTEQPQGALSSFTPSVPYKVVSGGKGQLNTISPTSGMLMDASQSASIKQNMQDLLKEYQSPWQAFKGNLRDMKADLQMNPAAAWAQRAAERQQQEANVYNLKMSMANMDATQNAARRGAQALGLPGYETTAPAQSGSASTPSGVPNTTTSSGIPLAPTLPPFQVMRNSLSDSDRAIFDYSLSQGDIPAIMKLAAQSSLKRPDTQKLYEFANKLPEDQKQMFLGQIFEKGMAPRSYIENGKTIQYSPEVSLPPEMRQKPQTTGVSAGISPTATAYVESRGNPNAVSPAGARGVMQVMPNTQRDPGYGVTPARDNSAAELDRVGTDYHAALTKKYGSDTFGSLAYNMGPGAFEKWLASSGGDFKKLPAETQSYIGQVHVANALLNSGQPNIVTNTMGGRAPAVAMAAPGINTVSKEDIAMQQENLGKTQSAFIDTTYKPLSESVKGQENDVLYADRVLEALNKGEYGPGTSIGQMLNQGMQALGFKLSPEEQDKYLRNLTIEQAKQQFVALGAKAAMGSQYTGKESENFAKTLAGINDPKEFIRTVYELKKAKALIDDAHKQFLEESPSNMMKANKEWKNSGIRERIMKETVTSFNKAPKETEKKAQASESAAKLPAGAPADAKVGTDASGKPGWFVVRGGKTLQWKP